MEIKKEINVFIVDDNKIFALALKGNIETAFKNKLVKISTFETGEACMENFLKVMPELVILDYYLNSKSSDADNGLQILDKIKKINHGINVIMLTSNDDIDIA